MPQKRRRFMRANLPMSPIYGLERIIGTLKDFDGLLTNSASSCNAITSYIGSITERGYKIVDLINRFGPRPIFVHGWDILGRMKDLSRRPRRRPD